MPATSTLFLHYGNRTDGRPYGIAFIAISSVFICPLLALWIISLRAMQRGKDPARGAVTWIKVLLGLWIFFLVLTTILAGLNLHQVLNNPMYFYQPINITKPGRRILRLTPVPDWFGILANIILCVTFIEVGLGFLYCLGKPRVKSSSKTRCLRFSPSILGVILFFISAFWYTFGHFVLEKAFEVIRDRSYSDTVPFYMMDEAVELRKARKKWVWAGLILDIFMLVFGLKAFLLALIVVVKTSRHRMRNSAMLFLTATILNTIRQAYVIVMHAVYVLPLQSAPEVPSLIHPLVIAPLVDFVQMFVILVFLYVIATRKSGGLWSGVYLAPEQDETCTPLVLPQMTPATRKDERSSIITVRYDHDGDAVLVMEDDMRRMSVSPMSIPSVDGREPNRRLMAGGRDDHDEDIVVDMEVPKAERRY